MIGRVIIQDSRGSYGSFSISYAWKAGETSQKLAAFAGVPVLAVQLLLNRWRRLTDTVTSLPWTNYGGSSEQPLPDTARQIDMLLE
jgi:hypothetical protein